MPNVTVDGVVYVCPIPSPLHRHIADHILQGLSHEEVSCMLAFLEQRGFKDGLLSVERFVVEKL
jgi:hypothetical protein